MSASVPRTFWRRLVQVVQQSFAELPEALRRDGVYFALFRPDGTPGRIGDVGLRIHHHQGQSLHEVIALALREAPDEVQQDSLEGDHAPVKFDRVFRGHFDFIPVFKAHRQRAGDADQSVAA